MDALKFLRLASFMCLFEPKTLAEFCGMSFISVIKPEILQKKKQKQMRHNLFQ